jgi:predicted enzyme related to lactoylglutathione lyase
MPNPIVHFEVIGKDALKLQKFYGDLFGWKIQNMAEMGNYGMIEAQEGHGIGGGVGGAQEGPGHVTFYVEVDDPQAYLDKAAGMGGKIVMPATDMGMVVYGMFADPEGHMVGVVKSGEQH